MTAPVRAAGWGVQVRSSGRAIKSALAGRIERLRSLLPHEPPPAILMYHRIAEESFDPWGLAVNPSNFRDHLAWLSQNRTLLPLAEFAALHGRGSLPRDAVAVTLDDGYSCAGEVAAPLLKQFNVPATIFVPVEVIESGEPYWWDELEEMILEHDGRALTIDGEEFRLGKPSAGDRRWVPGSPASTQRQAAFEQIHTRLSRKRPAELKKAMAALRRQTKRGVGSASRRPMTPGEVRKVRSSLIEFGSHSLTHAWLTSLDHAGRRHEIYGSVDHLERLTGSRPSAFAYPYGIFDETSEELAMEAGFACACATRDAAVSRRSRPFALPRVHVPNCDAAGLDRLLARVRAA